MPHPYDVTPSSFFRADVTCEWSLVQVVLDPLLRPLGRDLGAEALEVDAQLLGLILEGYVYEDGHVHRGGVSETNL